MLQEEPDILVTTICAECCYHTERDGVILEAPSLVLDCCRAPVEFGGKQDPVTGHLLYQTSVGKGTEPRSPATSTLPLCKDINGGNCPHFKTPSEADRCG